MPFVTQKFRDIRSNTIIHEFTLPSKTVKNNLLTTENPGQVDEERDNVKDYALGVENKSTFSLPAVFEILSPNLEEIGTNRNVIWSKPPNQKYTVRRDNSL